MKFDGTPQDQMIPIWVKATIIVKAPDFKGGLSNVEQEGS